jgi:hypothetical protein
MVPSAPLQLPRSSALFSPPVVMAQPPPRPHRSSPAVEMPSTGAPVAKSRRLNHSPVSTFASEHHHEVRDQIANDQADQIGLAPGAPHLANLPLASLQRAAFSAALGGHFAKCPLASLQGAANDGVDNMATATAAAKAIRMVSLPRLNRFRRCRRRPINASASSRSVRRGRMRRRPRIPA